MKNILLIIFISFSISQDFDELYFGSENDLDIMTWNIERFPKNGSITVNYVTQIISALDMDVIAIQEVDDIGSFNQLLYNLDGYEGYLESSWFAGLAFIYKTETVEINNIYEIYTTSEYWSPFPRSPMVMDMNFMGENYIIINNHYKCCGDDNLNLNDESDEENRRYMANTLLKEYIEDNLSNENVILLGDLNDNLTDSSSDNVFQMFLNDSENYLFADYEIAQGSISDWSYPSWPSHIDHILITNELFGVFEIIETIRIDYFMDGGFNDYDQNISDHRPVAIKIASSSNSSGDINNDGFINVVDVIVIVNFILNNEYNSAADLNLDSILDVLDLIDLINIILHN